jgi:hypothetical protein
VHLQQDQRNRTRHAIDEDAMLVFVCGRIVIEEYRTARQLTEPPLPSKWGHTP